MLHAVPQTNGPTLKVGIGGLNSLVGGNSPSSLSCTVLRWCTNSPAKWTALTPRCVIDECASKPVNLVTYICAPLWACTTVIIVGSPMMMARGLGTSLAIAAASECAPMQPTSSSYDSAKWIGLL